MLNYAFAGLFLLFVGFAVLILGLMLGSRSEERRVKGAGVILVGPIPIVFGSDAKWATIAVVLAIVLVLLMIALYLA